MRFNKLLLIIILTLCLISCSKDDTPPPPPPEQLVTNAVLEGLLGQPILIQGENFSLEKLQVFFDLERAQINLISPILIEVVVPRTLKRPNPTLKVINLVTNKDILNTTFMLKAPKITKYSDNQITFNETLVIHGENFDVNEDDVVVYINDEKVQLLRSSFDQIEIYIPFNLKDADLKVKVKTQLQEVMSSGQLSLRAPVIEDVQNDMVWLGGNLNISGSNFNPVEKYGEVLVNGVKSHYTAQNSKLSISVPLGPFSEFQITNITYKTAGLVTSYNVPLDIGNVGVMVDLNPNLISDVVVYNGKGYAFSSDYLNSNDTMHTVEMREFSPETETWTKVEGVDFQGYINGVVFDNSNSLYLYKGSDDNKNELTKLNLDTFTETKINIPFHESLSRATMFSIDGDLFVINGWTYENNQSIVSNKRYRYKSDIDQWEEITSDLFTDTFWQESIYNLNFHKGDLYFSRNTDTGIYRLNADFSVTKMPGTIMLFSYGNSIIGRQTNIVNERMRLYNIFDVSNSIELAFGGTYNSAGWFFVLNDTIYYHKRGWLYDGNVELATYKLKKELLHEIL
jgi:hypothetical protein